MMILIMKMLKKHCFYKQNDDSDDGNVKKAFVFIAKKHLETIFKRKEVSVLNIYKN